MFKRSEGKALPNEKQRHSAYKKGLVIYISLLFVVFAASQILLWCFLSSYQKGQCDYFAGNYVDRLGEDDWRKLLSDGLYGSELCPKEKDVDGAYSAYFAGSGLSCRRSPSESKNDVNVFKITKDGTPLCTLTVEKSGSGAFNMPRWKVTAIKLDESFLEAVNPKTTLYTPGGSRVTFNGEEIKSDKFKDCESPFATEFEQNRASGFLCFEYRAPFGEYELSSTLNGKALTMYDMGNGRIGFDFDGAEKRTVVITAPSGSEVYLNSVRLSTQYITGKNLKYPFLNPLEENAEGIPSATEYTVGGLYEAPDVKVLYGGEELVRRDDGGDKYVYPFNTGVSDYTLSLPEDAIVYVNGICISDSDEYVTEKGIEYAEVGEYKNELINPRVCRVYSLKGLFFKPTFEVKDSEGNKYELINYEKNSYRCDLAPKAESIPQFEELALGFAKAMMEYTFIGRDALNDNFKKVLELTRVKSKAYDAVSGSYSGMYWRRDHTIEYNSLRVDNYVSYAENAFRCDVHYDVTGKRVDNGREERVVGIYRLLYINAGDGWKVVELNLLNESE